MGELRLAVFGCGFWAHYQVAAWRELAGVRVVAACDPQRERAESLAATYGIAAVYSDPAELLRRETVDAVDIVSSVESHVALVRLVAAHGLPAICQKPLAASLSEAEALVAACHRAGTPLIVHENWRWQAPLRAVKQALDSGAIGRVFRARVEMISGFPLFANQPALAEMPQFIMADLGPHTLDSARFLFGEPKRLYCTTARVHPAIKGEDVATVLLETDAATVLVTMAYAENYLERECFPQTLLFIEGERGSIELAPDYWVRVTTASGTHSRRHPPPRYAWADPAYDVVQASMVLCNANILRALTGGPRAETSGDDNLKTLRLVYGAYESAATGRPILV
ncbi:MAG: Gfo/Idh/MocA family oxidoreductase [Chloroflexales bacterium]|nr:Gfo/Idh/MocA family oxidoreductase [Chloroflexales bacterium]